MTARKRRDVSHHDAHDHVIGNHDIELDLTKFTPKELLEKEWLLTNGLGGYASGTLLGIVMRRYHGLFVPNLANPTGRHLMISCYCEKITTDQGSTQLGCASVPNGSAIDASALESFRLQGNTAHWIIRVGDAVIEKSILMPQSQNSICVRYTLLSGSSAVLAVRPYFAFRRHDAPLNQAGYAAFMLSIVGERYEVSLANSPLVLRMTVRGGAAIFVAQPSALDLDLQRERRRGHEHAENAQSLGFFQVQLQPNTPVTFVATTHNRERLDFDVASAFEAEAKRISAIDDFFVGDRIATRLAYAADQFLVLPASRLEDSILAQGRGHELRSVIAGYHWFGDWGRDTMISLEGLMLCTGRYREARATLQTFASYVVEGLLPNLFPEGERLGLYHTVDATLWFFHALHRYLRYTTDTALLQELLPTLESIVKYHIEGTRFGIHMDSDGLITAAAEGYQLTWMDAKVDGWVVTPRRGKPVEIQALWYNALCLMAIWTQNDALRSEYRSLAELAARSFNGRYWNAERRSLLDVVDGPAGDDDAIRPNQQFAISLDHPILIREQWDTVVDTLQSKLLTPFGMRTLSRDHTDYKQTYHGDLRSRDAAYHQGTVWPWLIGHFIDCWLKCGRSKAEARQLLSAFELHFADAGIGTISEIFDAEPPHAPHGCIAQAWSIGEVLRAWQNTKG